LMWVGGEMNNIGSMGIVYVALFSGFLLVGTTTSSILLDVSNDISMDARQILNDVVDEITTYLKIEEVIGKYNTTNEDRSVDKIVILVDQFIQNTINVSEIVIKICNNNDVLLLRYSGRAIEVDSGGIFENYLWNTINNTFDLIVIIDDDRSLLEYGSMNKDMVFFAIKLPASFAIKKRESITVSITPGKGITSSIVLKTPSFCSSDIISFEEI
jgi:archaellin